MIVYTVHVFVHDDHIDDFIEATMHNHRETRKESGNIRFDIIQDRNDPCRFMLIEVYDSDDAVSSHKESPHYLIWRDKVAEWMAQPRHGETFRIIAPTDMQDWAYCGIEASGPQERE